MIPILLAALALLPQEEEVVRLTEWPALERDVATGVENDVQRLRKARTEEMGAQADAALGAVGAGAAPALLDALGKEDDEAARGRIVRVLDAVTGAPHTRLLAHSFTDESGVVRTYVLRRVARFPDPETRAAAEAALKKAKRPGRGEKADLEEVAAAALAVTASGSLKGLSEVLLHVQSNWSTDRDACLLALEEVRGEAATYRLLPHLSSWAQNGVVATLRVLGGCGIEAAVPKIRPLLDHQDVQVRTAAVNALRGIVDGEPPYERLTAFQSIEKAREWKRRLP
jgi:HEAT repeat protein